MKVKQKFKEKSPVLLVILDGFGIAPASRGNAVTLAKTPFLTHLFQDYPNTQICASGRCAGLPTNQHGNSEAGHLNLGAGRIVDQDSVRISKSINEGTFFKNPAFVEAVEHVKKNHSRLHIMGLLSGDQSPHMQPDHLIALLTFCRLKKVKTVYLHLFTDGRDSPPYKALEFINRLKGAFKNGEKIVTLCGRFYLDRKKNWTVTEKIYNCLTLGKGLVFATEDEAILHSYNMKKTDEFVPPSIIGANKKEALATRIGDNDSVIFYNHRSDRARQLTKFFVQPNLEQLNDGVFPRERFLKNLKFIAMTDFGPDLPGVLTAYPSVDIVDTLPMALKPLRQLYIAETEKYAHVTFFFNGGYDHPVAEEERILVPSPPVDNYKKTPEMSSPKILAKILEVIDQSLFDFICVNFCNGDMIGHTGNLPAGIKAVEYLDGCLKQLVKRVLAKKGVLYITADHGNIEEMTDLATGEINTEHSSFPVPFIIVDPRLNKKIIFRKDGILADVAPTILSHLGLKKPALMTGKPLCQF
ncbi:MAG: 2,3-bisphosphoglycerate-independent phosphoglycerate mutase [Patescibacteria group bacterium]